MIYTTNEVLKACPMLSKKTLSNMIDRKIIEIKKENHKRRKYTYKDILFIRLLSELVCNLKIYPSEAKSIIINKKYTSLNNIKKTKTSMIVLDIKSIKNDIKLRLSK